MMKALKALYLRYREVISYLFFGGLTTVLNLLAYALFVGMLGLGVTVGNILSWLCAVLFAFVTNKIWVFESKSWKGTDWLREAAAFFTGRIATGLLELFGLPFLIWLGLDQPLFGVEGFAAKVIVTIVVIILNYIISKLIVFRKKK